MDKLDKYLDSFYLQEELNMLNEFDLTKLSSKIPTDEKANGILKKLNSSINMNKPKESLVKMKKVVSGLPSINTSSVESFATKKIKNYKAMKGMSQKIIENSLPGISNNMVNNAAIFLAISSNFSKKDEKVSQQDVLKRNIKTFVLKVRKFADDFDDSEEKKKTSVFQKEDIPDLAVAWVIVAMATAIAIGFGTGIYAILTSIAAFSLTGTLMAVILLIAVILSILSYVPSKIK